MNIPYNLLYFSSYESLKKIVAPSDKEEHRAYHHILAGGGAGVCAAIFTNPLDVAKTRLQTQGESGIRYHGMFHALETLWRTEGMSGYLKGAGPRAAFHSMSAAICWAVYEQTKAFLISNN